MAERGAAVILSQEEVDDWKHDYYYLPHLAVKQPKKSTPVRLCFDASRRQGGYPSLNDCLMKGPERFMNNLLSVLIGFRNGRIGCAADISKFHNRVYLTDKDMHMQRFLWRDMKIDLQPQTYAVCVNNFGVKPANCIATIALHKSADAFSDIYPRESQELKEQTYIDDELISALDEKDARLKTQRMDEICKHAGMPNKGWVFSGEEQKSDIVIGCDLDAGEERVLGLSWVPREDVFKFHVKLNLSGKSKEKDGAKYISAENILQDPPKILTRRIVLSEISKIFDPLGFIVPVLLESKLLIRESWCTEGLSWDSPLPAEQTNRWIKFLTSLFDLESLEFLRSLWPMEEVEGLPMLIVFSDGAKLAYGAVAYIRWKLRSGGFGTRLIMSKSKIAPKKMISIPRMELNGANLGNRIKNFILKETCLKFEKTYQFVDSSTVLGYVQKEYGKFRPYEGERIAEIQSSNMFQDGKLVGWAWVASEDNPADWCTKPRAVGDLPPGGFWERGPDFFNKEESEWPIRFTYKSEKLDGEILPLNVHTAVVQDKSSDVLHRIIERCGTWRKCVRVMAWVLRIFSLKGKQRTSLILSAVELKNSKFTLLRYAQRCLQKDLSDAAEWSFGRFRKLAPMKDENGVWRVGSRFKILCSFYS